MPGVERPHSRSQAWQLSGPVALPALCPVCTTAAWVFGERGEWVGSEDLALRRRGGQRGVFRGGGAADPCFLKHTAQIQTGKRPRLLPLGCAPRRVPGHGGSRGSRLPAPSLAARLGALGSSTGCLRFQSQTECDGGEDGDPFSFWPLICRDPFPVHTKLEGQRAGLLPACHTALCYTSKGFWLKSKKHYPEKKANCE